jgi:16S rRNA C967 or C1407 C5-methylase (RsmB/RsmF family)
MGPLCYTRQLHCSLYISFSVLYIFHQRCYYALQGIHNQRFEAKEKDLANGDGSISFDDGACLVSCTTDEERQSERLLWRKYLGKILPASFRFGKDVPDYYKQTLTGELESLLQKAQEYVPEVDDDTDDKLPRDPRAGPLKETATEIHALTFCPHAYQLSGLDRATIRKNPALEQLHLWLKQQVAVGYITRQETVSMIPPILLNVISTDIVLDMCAAPGSKTSQILEDLQCNVVDTTNDVTQSTAPKQLGCLVANDASAARACMLVSQLRRILHMHPVALITAVNAQYFPSDIVQFDKILCDVPCSGDGTTRKNINVWKTWSASGALALHTLQLSIAMKGAAQLLKTGGTMVYSTCSLNPIENEAVVAELLRQSHGALELVDYQHENNVKKKLLENAFTDGPLPGFRTRPGMNTWKVLCEDMTQRQQKNKEKKNNAKMKKKRELFAGNINVIDSKTSMETGTPTNQSREEELHGDVINPIKVELHDDVTVHGEGTIEENITIEEKTDRPNAPRFEPIAWDETTLLQLAESEGLRHYTSIKEVPSNLNRRIRTSAFPPTPDEIQQFHLERCIRCLPQDNNTGGFFVALLRKVSTWSANDRRHKERNAKNANDNILIDESVIVQSNNPTSREAKRPRNENANKDEDKKDDDGDITEDDDVDYDAMEGLDADNMPINNKSGKSLEMAVDDFGKDDFAAVRDDIMDPLIEHYGISNGFDKTLYMARACSESKVIYYVGCAVKQLFDLGIQKRVTIVNTGLKGFMRNNRNVADCAVTYRVCQEGVHFLVPYMTKRKYIVGREDFRTCLLGDGKTIHLSKFSDDFRNQVKEESPGSFVVILDGYEDKLDQKLMVCMWKCRGESIDSLVAKVEVDGLLSKLDSMDIK